MVSPVVASAQQELALIPASATELSPPTAHRAIFETVLNTGTSRPMRSVTVYVRVVGSTQLMSKMLNGPPGSPLGLCSGTSMTSISPIGPFFCVPHTGQPGELPPQLFKTNSAPSRAMRFRSGTILVFIQSPPTISGAQRPIKTETEESRETRSNCGAEHPAHLES